MHRTLLAIVVGGAVTLAWASPAFAQDSPKQGERVRTPSHDRQCVCVYCGGPTNGILRYPTPRPPFLEPPGKGTRPPKQEEPPEAYPPDEPRPAEGFGFEFVDTSFFSLQSGEPFGGVALVGLEIDLTVSFTGPLGRIITTVSNFELDPDIATGGGLNIDLDLFHAELFYLQGDLETKADVVIFDTLLLTTTREKATGDGHYSLAGLLLRRDLFRTTGAESIDFIIGVAAGIHHVTVEIEDLTAPTAGRIDGGQTLREWGWQLGLYVSGDIPIDDTWSITIAVDAFPAAGSFGDDVEVRSIYAAWIGVQARF